MVKIKEGVSVFEVLIALALIVAGVIAFVEGKEMIIYKSTASPQQFAALSLARDHLIQLQQANDKPATGSTVVNSNSTRYTVSWTEETYTNPDNKVMFVSVAWEGGKGVQQSVGLIDDIKLKKSTVRSEVVDEL
ncbi:MAG: hypothetical protein P1U34_08845 [Coxiellaceae bacterium]|nr:hypothetical protein [Coxiellaceae bacterium]